MVWRLAEQQDLDWIHRFLMQHVQSSMFLLSNLEQFGLGNDAPRALNLWVLEDSLHPGLIGITNEGIVMPQAPNANECEWRAAAALWSAWNVTGVLGDTAQARQFIKFACLNLRPTEVDRDEPSFALRLENLRLPELVDTTLHPLTAVSQDVLVAWRAAYHVETLGADPEVAQGRAVRDINRYLRSGTHWVLMLGDQPLSTCGVNAQAPGVVQIGGVYTPPDLRGRGYARRATALMLQQAAGRGIDRAVCFAAVAAAAKAYVALGFELAGSYTLVIYGPAARPQTAAVKECT